ncbi:MAG: hypothetical protein WCE40_06630 [Polyangia bacterium]|jgi:hypothetical protein
MDTPITKLPSALQYPFAAPVSVPRCGHGEDRDLGASLDQVLKVQATPIPGAEVATEDLEYRRRLIAHIRTQDAMLINAAMRGSMEGLVAGGVFQIGWGLFSTWRAR